MALNGRKNDGELKPVEQRVEHYLKKRQKNQLNDDFEKSRRKIFRLAIVCCMALICSFYFGSSLSKVKSISVTGNYYLDSSYVQSLSGLSLESRYLLIIPGIIENEIEKDGMIENCEVELLKGEVIRITVQEKKAIGYMYSADSPEILMADQSTVPLKSEYLSIIARIPYITGFETDDMKYHLCKASADIDQNIIENISEISQYELSYDSEALKIIMRDGGTVIAGYYSTSLLNQYNSLSEKQVNKDYCIYAEEGSTVAYSAVCPWDQEEQNLDYWTDDSGAYITNSYGDRCVKHYYQDGNGDYYLDESGNWILIPIDQKGNELKDKDFEANYEAGYYAGGTLVIPQDN